MTTAVLLPVTVLSLVLAVAALGFRAGRRQGIGPFAVGVAAAVTLVTGKFVVESDAVVYGGIASLVGASVWNSWPTRSAAGSLSAPSEALLQLGSDIKGVRHGDEA